MKNYEWGLLSYNYNAHFYFCNKINYAFSDHFLILNS